MKLFLISQNVNNGYDVYDSAVVSAPDRKTARDMNPSNGEPYDWSDGPVGSSWANKRKDVKVEYLGETKQAQGVICASFNAG